MTSDAKETACGRHSAAQHVRDIRAVERAFPKAVNTRRAISAKGDFTGKVVNRGYLTSKKGRKGIFGSIKKAIASVMPLTYPAGVGRFQTQP